MQLTRALQWLHFTAAVVVMAAMGWNATAQTAGPAAPNKAPTASITSPANNASFPAGSNITIAATASDSDGTVTKVDFLSGATVVGTSTTSPYSFTWQNVAAGSYSLTARATDNKGATGTSTAVNITVTPNAPPTVSITAPANGASYVAPASVVISATAADSNGTVTRVEFFQGTTSLGFVNAPPYTVTWPGVAAGAYFLTAKATDNQNAVTTSAPVSISVGAPPLVVMTSPDNCSTATVPANVTLAADAVDIDGWIVSVDFFADSNLVGSATRLPYSVVWTNAPAGTHSLTARATDNSGISATSVPITLTVTQPNTPPTVSITAPAAESTFRAGATVTITATAADSDGTVSQVAFYRSGSFIASSNGPVFSVPWTNIPAGDFQLTAVATDNGGASTTSASVHVIVQPNAAPTAHLTAPANGASYRAPATISFTATAADSDGTVAKVDFLLNGNQVATSSTAPYAGTATNVAAGTYSVVARATDNDGATGNSPEVVSITVAANALPVVNITSPANGAAITAPTDVPITATATDSDGTIAKVEFFGDGVLLKTVTAPPYSATWVNVPLGDRTVLVRATDNDGGISSATATIHVTGIRSEITAPPDGSTYVGPAAFDLVAKLAASSGLLTKVEFYDGSALVTSFDISPPGNPITFTLQLSAISPGTHVYTAKVFDSTSRVATSPPITVVVTVPPTPPTVTLTSPTPNEFYLTPATVSLSANTIAGSNPVARVDFLANGNVVGSANTAPYTFTWANVAAGNYNMTASAIDTVGITGTSAASPITVGAAPTITIDPGIDGSTVGEDTATVTGVVQSVANSGVTIDGRAAVLTASGRFFMNDLQLVPGANTFTVTVTAQDGQSASQPLTINRSGTAPFLVTVAPAEGLAPAIVTYMIEQVAPANFGSLEIDLNGDGITDFTYNTLDNRAFSLPAGHWRSRLTFKDPAGSVLQTRNLEIDSFDPIGRVNLAQALFKDLVARLTQGNVSGATLLVTEILRPQYQTIFTDVAPDLTDNPGALGQVVKAQIDTWSVRLLVIQGVAPNDEAFVVSVVRGADGVWRLDGM